MTSNFKNSFQCYLFDIPSQEWWEKNKKRLFLSPSELSYIQKTSNKKRGLEFALGRHLVRRLLTTEKPGTIEEMEMIQGTYGKPYFNHPRFKSDFFNISHCKEKLLLGISNSEIGLDIENKNRKLKVFPKLIQRVFSTEEREFCKKDQKSNFFFRTWTQKEAISKCCGLGLQADFSRIDLLHSPSSVIVDDREVFYDYREVDHWSLGFASYTPFRLKLEIRKAEGLLIS